MADSATAATPSSEPLSAQTEKDGSGPDRAAWEEEFWFLQLNTHIVGSQHHSGKLEDGMCCELVRKGMSGLQVVNSASESVGWLSKEIAPTLCPFLEECDGIRPEVVVPRGSKQKYKVPVNIAFCGPSEMGEPLGRLATALKEVKTTKAGTTVIHVPEGIKVQQLDAESFEKVSGGVKASHSALLMKTKKDKSKLDISKGFEDLYACSRHYHDMPCAPQPAKVVTPLLEHQLKALHWAKQREAPQNLRDLASVAATPSALGGGKNIETSMLFWKREKRGAEDGFRNMITNSFVSAADSPSMPRGGFLCDDMGLGKTATMLGLVATDDFQVSSARLGTVVVCPMSLLSNWELQVREHCPSLRVGTYHGAGRQKLALAELDLVLTTFQTLVSESDKCNNSQLLRQSWRRIIVDEAHELRNHRSKQSVATMRLAASCEIAWGLTGTPIQNKVEDTFAMAVFLRIKPFDDKAWFNRCILRLVKQGNPLGLVRLRMLFATFILRRKKTDRVSLPEGGDRPLLALPEKSEEVVRIKLPEADRQCYDKLEAFVSKRMQGSQGLTSEILVLLLRLRQLCCAPALLPPALREELQKQEPDLAAALSTIKFDVQQLQALLRSRMADEPTCSICMEELPEGPESAITCCGHPFHADCIQKWKASGNNRCPLCNHSPLEIMPWAEEPAVEEGAVSISGAKVAKIFEIVSEADPQDSFLIFSQFTQFLDLVAAKLQGLTDFMVIDGSVPAAERQKRVANFQDGSVKVALCSLKAAGVGLNLTAANRVILCDPWWSPAVEAQAIDRCHRLGQQRSVRVLRLVAKGTVEEKIRAVQDQKRDIMSRLHQSKEELQSSRAEMVMNLFKGPWVRTKPAKGTQVSERPPKRRRQSV